MASEIGRATFRWWFLPSWLGLDAPCVVTTWTWAASCALEQELLPKVAAAMFLVVWIIYLSDRLIDVAHCQDWTCATGRLRFGRDYRSVFLLSLAACSVGLLYLLWAGISWDVLQRGVIVALGVALHCLLFVTPFLFRRKLPGKEFGVGLFFALGAYACLGVSQRAFPLFAAIALVVAFNCLVIAARDAESDEANDGGAASRWWPTLSRDLFVIGAVLTMTAVGLALFAVERHFFLALALAFALLTLLHRNAPRCSGDAVRALADFALFTPLVIFGLS